VGYGQKYRNSDAQHIFSDNFRTFTSLPQPCSNHSGSHSYVSPRVIHPCRNHYAPPPMQEPPCPTVQESLCPNHARTVVPQLCRNHCASTMREPLSPPHKGTIALCTNQAGTTASQPCRSHCATQAGTTAAQPCRKHCASS
jgi:hypothetical protein